MKEVIQARIPIGKEQHVATENISEALFRSSRDELLKRTNGKRITRKDAKNFVKEDALFKDSPRLQEDFVEWLFTTAGK